MSNPKIPAGMTEEWGVEHRGEVIYIDFYGTEDEESGHIRWTPSRSHAEAWKRTMENYFPGQTYHLVRRCVTGWEVVDGE